MAAYSPRNRITSRTLEQDIYRVNGFLFAKNPSEYGIFTEQDIAQRRAYIEKNKHKAQFAPLFADWNSAMIRYQERLREIREQTHTGGQVLRQEMEVGNMPSNAMSEPHISDIPVESQETPEEVFQSLKNELETAINQEMDPTEFLEALGIIREIPQNIPTARLLAVRYVFDRMAWDGYIVEKTWKHIVIFARDIRKSNEAWQFSGILQYALQDGIITDTDITTSLLVGTSDWDQYIAWYSKNTPNIQKYAKNLLHKYGISSSVPEEQIRTIRAAQSIPAEDQAFLLSYLQKGIEESLVSPAVSEYKTAVTELGDLTKLLSSSEQEKIREIARNTDGDTPNFPAQMIRHPVGRDVIFEKPATLFGVGALFFILSGKNFLRGGKDARKFSLWRGLKWTIGTILAWILGCSILDEWTSDSKKWLTCGKILDELGETLAGRRQIFPEKNSPNLSHQYATDSKVHTHSLPSESLWHPKWVPQDRYDLVRMFFPHNQQTATQALDRGDMAHIEKLKLADIIEYVHAHEAWQRLTFAQKLSEQTDHKDIDLIKTWLDPLHIPAQYAQSLGAHEAIYSIKQHDRERYQSMTFEEAEQAVLDYYRHPEAQNTPKKESNDASVDTNQPVVWAESRESGPQDGLPYMVIDIEAGQTSLFQDKKGEAHIIPLDTYLTRELPPEVRENLKRISSYIMDDMRLLRHAFATLDDSRFQGYGAMIDTLVDTVYTQLAQNPTANIDIPQLLRTHFHPKSTWGVNPHETGDRSYTQSVQASQRREQFLRIFDESDPQKRHINILRYIRKELGQSDMVAHILMQEAEGIDFTLPSYEEIRVGTWSRQNNYTSEQKEDIAQKLDTLTRDAKDEWEKHSHSIMLQFREAYPDANIDMEMAKNIFFENYILWLAHKFIAFTKLEHHRDTPQAQLLWEILGVGWLQWADSTKETMKDWTRTIMIEAFAIVVAGSLTAGVGALATVARWGYRFHNVGKIWAGLQWAGNRVRWMQQTVNRLWPTRSAMVKWAARGAMFYPAYLMAHPDRSIAEDFRVVDMAQSVAMMGVLPLAQKITSRWATLKDGKIQWKNLGWVITVDALALSAASITTQYWWAFMWLEIEPGNEPWTMDELLWCLVMATTFRGVSIPLDRFKLSVLKKAGEIQVQTRPIRTHAEGFPEVKMVRWPNKTIRHVLNIRGEDISFRHNNTSYKAVNNGNTTWTLKQRNSDGSWTEVMSPSNKLQDVLTKKLRLKASGGPEQVWNFPPTHLVSDGKGAFFLEFMGRTWRIRSLMENYINASNHTSMQKIWSYLIRRPITNIDELMNIWKTYPGVVNSPLWQRLWKTLRVVTVGSPALGGAWKMLTWAVASSLITTALTLINPYDDFGVADLAEIPLYMQFGLVMIAVNTLIDGGARWHYEANTPEFHIQSASTHTTH